MKSVNLLSEEAGEQPTWLTETCQGKMRLYKGDKRYRSDLRSTSFWLYNLIIYLLQASFTSFVKGDIILTTFGYSEESIKLYLQNTYCTTWQIIGVW